MEIIFLLHYLRAIRYQFNTPCIRLSAVHVGSLEPGKDADFVIWSKSPLDSGTVCLQTWIDGKKYFDREVAEQRASALSKERDELLAKAKKLAKLSGGGREGNEKTDTFESFFRVSLEHEFDGRERGCMGEE